MDLGLSGKVAFITGAGHGIGKAFSLAFAGEGVAVAIADINVPWAEAVAAEIVQGGGRAFAVECDVSDSAQVNDAVQRTAREFGQVDILVNDAVSPILTGAIEELDDEAWDDNFRINVKGGFYCIKAVAPLMKERRYGQDRQHGVGRRTSRRGDSDFGGLCCVEGRDHRDDGVRGARVRAVQH
ncbi:MAG: SDR family NAD(P)-dependent oxidoreductase [SAR202 cluster bacterium]|jgi:NAD(P)-dependent dehydrogenase (short-subunit alcohol dehydrogenase family)|nr:SDR family NAD(P)-dependent oxidoreductase [SAR202 cluster bacterium]MDP6300233.1 SDR family NAD(P)-dependent oxidoreductase [SAR202 cluster bacterium]MDP7103313.1 SDR family NAD(P)-dependent oxidoreductase [SAR202 cluster bacterium]MDP7224771.1 SDR family NAD(P)-dependent oxidoreductase [SAR202 cluster bacterium]MDP7412757.1 SDR family NAD(P)-dependent oxidoreductase [SAR202 cluster bacterium]